MLDFKPPYLPPFLPSQNSCVLKTKTLINQICIFNRIYPFCWVNPVGISWEEVDKRGMLRMASAEISSKRSRIVASFQPVDWKLIKSLTWFRVRSTTLPHFSLEMNPFIPGTHGSLQRLMVLPELIFQQKPDPTKSRVCIILRQANTRPSC